MTQAGRESLHSACLPQTNPWPLCAVGTVTNLDICQIPAL